MLTDVRREEILKLVNARGSINTKELVKQFNASESTIRRDIVELDKAGTLIKVHGGAISLFNNNITYDYAVSDRENQYREDKIQIAKYAATLIKDKDLVYIDTSTTTSHIIDYITASDVNFVTNGIAIAQELAAKGYAVSIPGGILKASTEAIVGEEAILYLSRYHFAIGFFGTNAITKENGCTTPEVREASIKSVAMKQCGKKFILSDASKFGKISSICFADFQDATIITAGKLPSGYEGMPNIIAL